MRKVWSRVKVMLPILVVIVALCLPASASASGGVIHVVCRGETLSGIAYRYGTTVWAIASANHIANPSYIWVGQRLVIPGGGGHFDGGYVDGGYHDGGCGSVHVVCRGETMYSIALRYGTTVWAIAKANGIANPSYIWAGQRLFIPCGGGYYPPAPKPPVWGCGVHVVCRGETLYSIACRYGTSVWAIAHANGLANPNLIWVGQRLNIPCFPDP
jgi:LysM repeat protein